MRDLVSPNPSNNKDKKCLCPQKVYNKGVQGREWNLKKQVFVPSLQFLCYNFFMDINTVYICTYVYAHNIYM